MGTRFFPLIAAMVLATPAMAAACLHPPLLPLGGPRRLAVRTGGVLRAEDVCYAFVARAEQRLALDVSSPDRNVVAAVYGPGVRVTPAADGPDIKGRTLPGAGDLDDARRVRAAVPASGRYLVVLGTARGGGGEYRLRISLR